MRERLNVVDCGDLVYAFGDARASAKLSCGRLLAAGRRQMLSFGGDHFVTLPLHAKHFGKMALVHFDAHTDTYANAVRPRHHVLYRAERNYRSNHSVQIGIRTEFDKDNGFTVLDAGEVNDRSVDDVIASEADRRRHAGVPDALISTVWIRRLRGHRYPVIGGLTSDRDRWCAA